jgi:hypothetical protein
LSESFDHFVCGVCGSPATDLGSCATCGASDMMVTVRDGYLAEFPADSVPCPACGSTERPLVFRGWVRLTAVVWWVREGRASGYLCEPCARVETTKVLLRNAVLGWWSVPSIFFYGWRATWLNWRSVWASPAHPHEWGAISAAEFSAELRDGHEQAVRDADDEWLLTETPLRDLNETQVALVLEADGLYELLGVDSGADADTIRAAYRRCSKESHPDLRHSTARDSAEVMIMLNRAWEVLRSPSMRRAYDWLEQQRSQAAA